MNTSPENLEPVLFPDGTTSNEDEMNVRCSMLGVIVVL